MAHVIIYLFFNNSIHYVFKKSAQKILDIPAQKQFSVKWPFKVTYFGVSGKVTRE